MCRALLHAFTLKIYANSAHIVFSKMKLTTLGHVAHAHKDQKDTEGDAEGKLTLDF